MTPLFSRVERERERERNKKDRYLAGGKLGLVLLPQREAEGDRYDHEKTILFFLCKQKAQNIRLGEEYNTISLVSIRYMQRLSKGPLTLISKG